RGTAAADPRVAAEVRDQLDLFAMRAAVRAQEKRSVDVTAILEKWSDRTDSEYYPAVLTTLLTTGTPPAGPLLEAIRGALSDPGEQYRTNTRLNLAQAVGHRLARRSASSGDVRSATLKAAVSFMHGHLPWWEQHLDITAVIDIRHLLAHHEP